MVSEPPALEGAAAEQGEVEPLRPSGLAPKRLRGRTIEQGGRGKQQQGRKGGGQEGAGKKQQNGECENRRQSWWALSQLTSDGACSRRIR